MALAGAPQYNSESLVINPVYSGLVQTLTPKSFNLAHNDIFPVHSFTSNGNGQGFYRRYSMADTLRDIDFDALTNRGLGKADALSRATYVETFRTRRRKLDVVVNEDEAKLLQAQGLMDPHMSEIAWEKELMLLAKERKAAKIAAQNSNFGYAGAPAYAWSDFVNSDPVADISDARVTVRNACGRVPNVLTLPWEVALLLSRHPKIKNLRGYTERSIITAAGFVELFKACFNFDDVIVFESMYNASRPSVAGTLSLTSVWGKHAMVFYRPPTQSLEEMVWGLDIHDKFYNGDFQNGVYAIPDLDNEVVKYRIKEDSEINILNKELALAIRNVMP